MLNLFRDNAFRESDDDTELTAYGESPPLDMTDEIIVALAKVIVIGTAVAFYDELAGLLILLGVALGMVYEQRSLDCREHGAGFSSLP